MEHIRILLLGVSFGIYISYKIAGPHGTYTHTSIRGFIKVYISYKIAGPHGTYTHTSIWGFMRAYINYKIRSRQKVEKIEKVEMAETREVRRGFTFLTDFPKKIVLDHANSQMYQSQKTLRLCREMSFPLTFIRPFRDNPQSCPLNYQRVVGTGLPFGKHTKNYGKSPL